MDPRLLTVGVASYAIDRMALAQARDQEGLLKAAKRQLVNVRNLKPGLLVSDGCGTWGALTKVVLSDLERRDPAALPSGVPFPARPPEIEVLELEWFLGRPDDDLGDLDGLVAP